MLQLTGTQYLWLTLITRLSHDMSDKLRWSPVVSLRDLNYIRIPVNQINPFVEFELANDILEDLKNKYKQGEFKRTPSGGLAKHVDNIMADQFEITQLSAASIEVLVFDVERGWTRIKFCNNFKTNDGQPIVGTKALRRLIELCPDIRDHVCLDEEENHYWRERARDFYQPYDGFQGVPDSELNGKEFRNVYSLDFHWAFPSALASLIPSTEEKLAELYAQRHTDKSGAIKALGVAAIGTMCSPFTTSIGLGAKEALAKLRYDILDTHNRRMRKLINEIERQGGLILNLRTDSIKFASGKRLMLPFEGDGLGKWSYEFEACRYRQASTGSYEYIDNEGKYHAVVCGLTKLDRVKPREEWEWGDIFHPDTEVLKIYFNWRTLKWENDLKD